MSTRTILLTVNGNSHNVMIQDNQILLDVLRERLGFVGTNEGCSEGECGACTVIMDGKTVNSCLVLAADADGSTIETIEGQSVNDQLSEVQQAFVEAGAIQCGFCTPGMIMSSTNLLRKNPNPSDDEIKEAMAGNLCRCTGYVKILQAVKIAAERRRNNK